MWRRPTVAAAVAAAVAAPVALAGAGGPGEDEDAALRNLSFPSLAEGLRAQGALLAAPSVPWPSLVGPLANLNEAYFVAPLSDDDGDDDDGGGEGEEWVPSPPGPVAATAPALGVGPGEASPLAGFVFVEAPDNEPQQEP